MYRMSSDSLLLKGIDLWHMSTVSPEVISSI